VTLYRGAMLFAGSALILFFAGFPLVWMFLTSVKPAAEILAYPPRVLGDFTLGHFRRLVEDTRFLLYLKNSVVVAGVTVIIDIVIASLGAYGLARYRFHGKELLSTLTLFTYMFAPIMIIIPIYVLLRNIGLADTHLGIILAYTSISLPFSLWLLRAFFESFPVALEEAAFVDGANGFQTFAYVVIPQALPGIIATSVFAFVVVWNDYLFARVLLSTPTLKTLPVGLQDIYQQGEIDWGLLMAGAVLVTVPATGFFLMIQRYLVQGWGMGAVKG
jgi:ABC-type glycerol-3-phosphate transport system permease component